MNRWKFQQLDVLLRAISEVFSLFNLNRRHKQKLWQVRFVALFSCSLLTSVWIFPAVSADRISFDKGVFGEFYISIDDLTVFAKTEKITPSFAYYADRFEPKDLAKLRALLNRRFDINQVTASTFLNLPIGKELIQELGLIIDSPQRVSQPALRGASILAAAEPGGLTILNVLRLYSTKTLKLNTGRIIEAVNEATKILADTERAFLVLEREAEGKISNSLDLSTLQDLRNVGSNKWHKEYLTVPSDSNNPSSRQTEAVVYLPVASNKPAPLIVIAPGLNTDWQNFEYIAKHLASYGFGVAGVNFPGTNAKRIDAVLKGLDTPPLDNQWVLQPQVVTRLLDEIENKSQVDSAWQGKLDLQNVGIIGQSLGGYTAMAIAGAKVDWQHLQQECQTIGNPEQINLNSALFWQCQGAANSIPDTDLQDERIVAAIAVNPVTNPVFSESGINRLKTPLMMIAGDKDLFTPALDEQLLPFSWLSEIDKYLVLVKNSTHFSFIGGEDSDNDEIGLPLRIADDDPALARSYLEVLSVAFFKIYLAKQKGFALYLTETYIESISKQPLPINLLRSLDSDRLKEIIED